MIVSFDELSPNSKIWVFKGERPFDKNEKEQTQKFLQEFMGNWLSHGAKVQGGFQFFEDQFLLIGAESEGGPPSGCSTDSLVHFIQDLSKRIGIDLMDNGSIFFKEGDSFKRVEFQKISEFIEKGELKKNTLVLNSQVTQKKDLNERLIVAAINYLGPQYF